MSTVGMDSHSWLGKEEAAQLLGVSTRQLERLTQDGQIEKKTLPRGPGEKTARAVYSRDAIEARKRGEQEERPKELAVTAGRPDALALLAEHLTRTLPAPAPKPWLTLKEAAAYSGLTKTYLLSQAMTTPIIQRFAINIGSEAHVVWRFNRDKLAR